MFQRAGMRSQSWNTYAPTALRVVGRAAGDELDALDALAGGSASGSSSSSSIVVVVDAAGDRGEQRLGLLVHLLEHEVRVAALLGRLDRPVDLGAPGARAASRRCR